MKKSSVRDYADFLAPERARKRVLVVSREIREMREMFDATPLGIALSVLRSFYNESRIGSSRAKKRERLRPRGRSF